jgi:hypothetical protein
VERYGVQHFEEELGDALREKRYPPEVVLRRYLPKAVGRKRPLGIATVRDRVAQMVAKLVLEPLFEAEFLPCSYGFRPRRGALGALEPRRERGAKGHHRVLDADIRDSFRSIDHDDLTKLVARRVSDRRTPKPVRQWLEAGGMEDAAPTRGMAGTPQGGVISPLSSNVQPYLLDVLWTRHGAYLGTLVRYADDFVVMCGTKRECEEAERRIRVIFARLGVQLNPDETRRLGLKDRPMRRRLRTEMAGDAGVRPARVTRGRSCAGRGGVRSGDDASSRRMRTTKERAGRRGARGAAGDARPARGMQRSDRRSGAAKRTSPTNGARRDGAPGSAQDPGASSLVDRVTAAWGAIVVERIAADQDFAEAFERYRGAPKDIRAVFAWDEVLSAEAHLSLVNRIIARHLDEAGRGDPFAILEQLRQERRRLAAVYAVNAFRAVLGQMSRRKPRWRSMEGGDFDERIAVLALAHQTLARAVEAARVPAPADLTEPLLAAAQDPRVWEVRNRRSDGLLLAAMRAAEAFFERIGGGTFADAAEIGRLYRLGPARLERVRRASDRAFRSSGSPASPP